MSSVFLLRRFAPLGALALLAGVVGLVAAGCGAVRSYAVSVDGHELSQPDVDKELRALADNELYARAGGIEVVGDGTLPATDTAAYLTLVVQSELARQLLDEQDVEITDEDRDAGRASLEQQFAGQDTETGDQIAGADVLNAFPEWFRDELIDRVAALSALQSNVQAAEPTDEEVREAFEGIVAPEVDACATGLFLKMIVTSDVASAEQAKAAIDGGASFAEVASAASIDTQGGQVGGEVGCFDPASLRSRGLDEAVVAAAEALEPGEVSAPVPAPDAVFLVQVDDEISFEALRPAAEQAASQDAVRTRLAEADVKVNPRYGEWVVDDEGARVEPPVPPVTTTSAPLEIPLDTGGSTPAP